MIRNMKALGLALVALLAMSAVVASGAQAEKTAAFTAEEFPVILDGKDEPETGALTRDGRTVTCNTATYSGEATEAATTVTVFPLYENCSTALGPATVKLNGCHYIFHFTADILPGEKHTYTALTDLWCPEGKEVEVFVYTSHTNHTNNAPTCVYKFGDESGGLPTNQGLKGIDLTNKDAEPGTPVDWITADITAEGIHSKRTTGGALLCGKEVDTAGVLHAKVELKGTNLDKEPNGITISTH